MLVFVSMLYHRQIMMLCHLFFFFSSRRRHTRYWRDWSSDVCSSDLLIRKHFKLTPRGIIESLDLRRPIYRETARHGHFGRELPSFTWERTDKVKALKQRSEERRVGKECRSRRSPYD